MSKTIISRATAAARSKERPLRPMSPAEVRAAALSDPDARPWTKEELSRAKHTPRTKLIRRALGLTQEEFAARFCIPLGTLRDWEQGAAEPDQAARSYLTVIARNPKAVDEALRAKPGTVSDPQGLTPRR
jgi:putative transcriptional regulator